MLKEERELSVKWEGTKVTLMGIAENIAVRNWSWIKKEYGSQSGCDY